MIDVARREDAAPALTPYLILGLVALVLFLVLRAPASLLQKALPASLPLRVSAWGGTVWDGQAALQQGEEAGFARWELLPSRLFTGHLALVLHAQGALDLNGRVELGPRSWRVQDLRGEAPVRLLQPLLPPGWSLPGSVRLEQLSLARAGRASGPWQVAAGRLRWEGGTMQYSLSGQPQGATLPPLVVGLRLDGANLLLNLSEEAGSLALADVRIAPDGTVETKLRERLLRYSKRTSGADPDAVVVTSVQKPK